MRRVVWRFAAVFALLATLIWVVSQNGSRAEAQQQSAAPRVTPVSAAATGTPGAPATPVVVVSGTQYANVRGLATDAAGGLYVSLSATPPAKNCVTSSASPAAGSPDATASIALTIFSNCALAPSEDPSGIAMAPGSKVYLANRAQNTIRLLDMLTGKVAAIPLGSGASVAQGQTSNLDPFEPAGLASDAEGNLYVADRGNNRVLALLPNAAHFTYLAHVLDAAAVASDFARGELYVASPASNQIFVIDLKSGHVNVFAGNGAFSESGSAASAAPGADASAEFDSAPQNAQLGAPEGVAVDGQGNVFISDTGANALVRVDAKAGTLSRVAIAGNLNSPGAMAIDRLGNVFVADRGDQRVVEFPKLGQPDPPADITISPASFDFGGEPTGGTTAPETFTLTNNSSATISLLNTSFTFAGADPLDFTETTNCLPSLAVGASCQINVIFTPGNTGARSATLEVTDADPSSPQTASLSGTGDDFELTVPNITDTTVSVSQGNPAMYTISVTPDNVFSGTVTLNCPAELSAKTQTVTCAIKPPTVNITPGQAQTFTVTLTTGGPYATRMIAPGWRGGPRPRMRLLLLGLFALMLALCAFPLWHASAAAAFGARRVRRARLAAFCFALLAGAALAGCHNRSSVNPNETPAGSYPVVITGTAQNAGRSITLTLNVT
ncbi:MAG: choice-of-anchor D domain-containing protein [Candidatus Acidiferrales bacterium]